MQIVMFGPAIPNSNSRAPPSSSASTGSSRCARPSGPAHALSSLSFHHAVTCAPRFVESASWNGPTACRSTNTIPIAVRGPASEWLCWTADTRTPIDTANAAGSSARTTMNVHHVIASGALARKQTVRNFHSADWRNRRTALLGKWFAPDSEVVLVAPQTLAQLAFVQLGGRERVAMATVLVLRMLCEERPHPPFGCVRELEPEHVVDASNGRE